VPKKKSKKNPWPAELPAGIAPGLAVVCEILRQLAQRDGVERSLTQLAHAAGVAQPRLHDFVAGKNLSLKPESLDGLARALGFELRLTVQPLPAEPDAARAD